MSTPTPRTNETMDNMYRFNAPMLERAQTLLELARTLERELAAEKARADEMAQMAMTFIPPECYSTVWDAAKAAEAREELATNQAKEYLARAEKAEAELAAIDKRTERIMGEYVQATKQAVTCSKDALTRMAAAEARVRELEASRDQWKGNAECLDRQGYEVAGERDSLRAQLARQAEALRSLSNAGWNLLNELDGEAFDRVGPPHAELLWENAGALRESLRAAAALATEVGK